MDFAQNCGVFGTQPPITSMPVRFVDRVGSLETTDGSGADAEQNPPVPLIVAFSKRVRRARAVPTPVMIILPALRPDVDGLVQQDGKSPVRLHQWHSWQSPPPTSKASVSWGRQRSFLMVARAVTTCSRPRQWKPRCGCACMPVRSTIATAWSPPTSLPRLTGAFDV